MNFPPPASPPLSILMYHQIGIYPRPDEHRALFCHIDRFRSQLRYLKWAGFDVINLTEARRRLFEGSTYHRRSVVITVDDGYDDFREFAWPALQEEGFSATVYLVSSLLGKNANWLTEWPTKPALMTAQAVRTLRQEGCDFGSHAVSHPRLSHLDARRQHAEIFDSKKSLDDLLGEEVPHFCYPYGDYSLRARDLVHEAGYRTATTCIRGAGNFSDNPFELTRKAISYGDNLIGFAWKLHAKHARKGQGAQPDRA
ncbi:MAG: polysaccharide deacetylase family protein [Burkholderiales bacterium]|nr:polysaccharide deacetylase family protein [Burkholderiales bacterium]